MIGNMNIAVAKAGWSPDSWQARPALQQPHYADQAKLARVLGQLASLPPVVVSWEVDQLKEELAAAQRGERFLLQGGDCAEGFADCESDTIARKLKILLQMSVVLLHGLKQPVIRVGRMAGQYAKPRSADTETRDGVTLPSYRGDIVNRAAFTPADREADPELLLRGYERAALTLNFVRALVDGGFADLHHPEYWDLGFMQHAKLKDAYQKIVDAISDSLDFYETVSGRPVHEAAQARFYASHEGLHLRYEQAQTRYLQRRERWYNLSTHMPWIGMRTAMPGDSQPVASVFSQPFLEVAEKFELPGCCRTWKRTAQVSELMSNFRLRPAGCNQAYFMSILITSRSGSSAPAATICSQRSR
jgi:3-deoxy-7-phosphoheptulonate synthase